MPLPVLMRLAYCRVLGVSGFRSLGFKVANVACLGIGVWDFCLGEREREAWERGRESERERETEREREDLWIYRSSRL